MDNHICSRTTLEVWAKRTKERADGRIGHNNSLCVTSRESFTATIIDIDCQGWETENACNCPSGITRSHQNVNHLTVYKLTGTLSRVSTMAHFYSHAVPFHSHQGHAERSRAQSRTGMCALLSNIYTHSAANGRWRANR